jgi:hypothetical protein
MAARIARWSTSIQIWIEGEGEKPRSSRSARRRAGRSRSHLRQLAVHGPHGRPGEGISVGKEWTYRQYIEGGSLASGVWTFRGIDERQFPELHPAGNDPERLPHLQGRYRLAGRWVPSR